MRYSYFQFIYIVHHIFVLCVYIIYLHLPYIFGIIFKNMHSTEIFSSTYIRIRPVCSISFQINWNTLNVIFQNFKYKKNDLPKTISNTLELVIFTCFSTLKIISSILKRFSNRWGNQLFSHCNPSITI